MESTGLYGLDLALALSGEKCMEVMVANPRAVRHYALAMMKRSKNDRIDAGVLEQFAAHMPFKPWQRPSVAMLALHALARRLRELVEMQTAEKNRQHAAGLSQAIPALVRRDLERSLRTQQRAIERLTREARKLIAKDAQLKLAISADKDAPFGQIIKVMDAAKGAKIKTVNAFTKQVATP